MPRGQISPNKLVWVASAKLTGYNFFCLTFSHIWHLLLCIACSCEAMNATVYNQFEMQAKVHLYFKSLKVGKLLFKYFLKWLNKCQSCPQHFQQASRLYFIGTTQSLKTLFILHFFNKFILLHWCSSVRGMCWNKGSDSLCEWHKPNLKCLHYNYNKININRTSVDWSVILWFTRS